MKIKLKLSTELLKIVLEHYDPKRVYYDQTPKEYTMYLSLARVVKTKLEKKQAEKQYDTKPFPLTLPYYEVYIIYQILLYALDLPMENYQFHALRRFIGILDQSLTNKSEHKHTTQCQTQPQLPQPNAIAETTTR